MSATCAILLTSTTYGTWLRGDRRGWVNDGVICPPDPEFEAADRARMKHPPFRFDRERLLDVGTMIGESLSSRMNLHPLAMTVQTWHVHVVIPATRDQVYQRRGAIRSAAGPAHLDRRIRQAILFR